MRPRGLGCADTEPSARLRSTTRELSPTASGQLETVQQHQQAYSVSRCAIPSPSLVALVAGWACVARRPHQVDDAATSWAHGAQVGCPPALHTHCVHSYPTLSAHLADSHPSPPSSPLPRSILSPLAPAPLHPGQLAPTPFAPWSALLRLGASTRGLGASLLLATLPCRDALADGGPATAPARARAPLSTRTRSASPASARTSSPCTSRRSLTCTARSSTSTCPSSSAVRPPLSLSRLSHAERALIRSTYSRHAQGHGLGHVRLALGSRQSGRLHGLRPDRRHGRRRRPRAALAAAQEPQPAAAESLGGRVAQGQWAGAAEGPQQDEEPAAAVAWGAERRQEPRQEPLEEPESGQEGTVEGAKGREEPVEEQEQEREPDALEVQVRRRGSLSLSLSLSFVTSRRTGLIEGYVRAQESCPSPLAVAPPSLAGLAPRTAAARSQPESLARRYGPGRVALAGALEAVVLGRRVAAARTRSGRGGCRVCKSA